MAHMGDEVEQDLSHIHWSWPEAVAANPERSLATADLALDYFAYSPFWDSKSNNSVLRTQRRVENPTYGHVEEKIELNAFTSGFEYIIAHSQPPDLFVVHRREVDPSGKRDRVTGAWFILNEKIYQCPTLYDVVSTRLKNAASLISKTLATLSENRPPANPRSTTIWRSIPPSTSSSSSSQPDPANPITPVDVDPNPDPNLDPTTATTNTDTHNLEESGRVKGTATTQKENASGPDWHLFHALQSTRQSLSELDTLAQSPRRSVDPIQELRDIETQMGLQFSFQQPQQSQGLQGQGKGKAAGGGSRPTSVRAGSAVGSTRMMGLSPGSTGQQVLTPGLGMGLSPAAGSGNGLTPRPGVEPRIPSAAGSVLGAGSPLTGGFMA
ncbi:hypothetical protein IAR55_001722 [Kwoniella newhampshirensis]|uniref:Mediator of RNA polymerase II transcription subunit 6 n=1 Tax=Kwoniella newhampshirensis TaxID=1651941 RepID=A0AAW0Z339_9TREE